MISNIITKFKIFEHNSLDPFGEEDWDFDSKGSIQDIANFAEAMHASLYHNEFDLIKVSYQIIRDEKIILTLVYDDNSIITINIIKVDNKYMLKVYDNWNNRTECIGSYEIFSFNDLINFIEGFKIN